MIGFYFKTNHKFNFTRTVNKIVQVELPLVYKLDEENKANSIHEIFFVDTVHDSNKYS